MNIPKSITRNAVVYAAYADKRGRRMVSVLRVVDNTAIVYEVRGGHLKAIKRYEWNGYPGHVRVRRMTNGVWIKKVA